MSERENYPTIRVLRCDEWENMIADALDSTLTAADAAAFTRHHGECALCAQMLKEAQQGREWMQYLAAEPEPPADLLKKILARTTERPEWAPSTAAEPGVLPPAERLPARPEWNRAARPSTWMTARQMVRQVLEPRLMMTLAMAFFSIALTLNLTGIHVTQMRAADLEPSRLRATLTRQYYATNEQVTKYYENLRLVYEMEARVRELRRSSEAVPSAQPSPAPAANPPARQRDGSGSPSSTVPKGELPQPEGGRTQGKATVALPAVMVEWQSRPLAPAPGQAELGSPLPTGYHPDPGVGARPGKIMHQVFRALPSTTEDQAKRSLV